MDGKDSDCIDGSQAGNMVNPGAEQSANGLDDLTPEQLVILHEKMELEKLLEVTKKLQQQANLFFSTKEATSSPAPSTSREKKKPNASGSPEIRGDASKPQCFSNNNDFSEPTEVDISTVTSESPKRDAGATEGATVPSTKHEAVCESPDSDGSRGPLSLRGNVLLLEENAELLQKKIELEVLLHRAKILLEHTGLIESNDNAGGDELPMENNVKISSQVQSTLDTTVQTLVDDNSGKVNNNREENSESNLEAFYEKASELTCGTESLSDVVQQNKAPCSNETPEQSTNCPTLNVEEDLKQASHGALTREASNHFSESETQSEELETEHVEMTDNRQAKIYDKHTIQQLLQKADLLLEQANRPRWSAENAPKGTDSESADDLRGLSVKQDFKETTSTDQTEDQTNKEAEALHTTANEESIAARLGQAFQQVLDQADESTDEDEDDDDDDDPSYDAKFHLQQLLQRARTVLERSKIPAKERLSEQERLGESPPTEEAPKKSENISDLSGVFKTKSPDDESRSDALDSVEKLPENNNYHETGFLENQQEKLTAEQAQTTDTTEVDFDSLTQEAQLEFLIRTTSSLKQKADSLICQINEPENPSTTTTTTTTTTSTKETHESATNCHTENMTLDTTISDQEHSAATTCTHEKTLDTAIGEEIRPGIVETADFRHDTEGCQLEYEEVEESQLQINESDKSPLEIEDEYASDGSDMCDMMQYYEDEESSEEESDFSETQTDGIKAELQQLQKVTDLLVRNSEFANETPDTRQPQDSSTSESDHLRPSVQVCNSHSEQENPTYQLQQAPGMFNCPASSETEFLDRSDYASQAPADKDGTVGGYLANEDGGAFDERAELRLLLEKTKLLLEKAKQPLDVEKKENETATNICPDDIKPLKHIDDSTANEDSDVKFDEISEIPSSTNQDISTVDTGTKSFDHAEVNLPQICGRSPENVSEKTTMSAKQQSCELPAICPVLQSELEEFVADEKVLGSVKEQETSSSSASAAFNADDVNKQDNRLLSVANSSELLSAQLTQIKAEINTILQEASAELTDSSETKTDLESSFSCNSAVQQRQNNIHEEQPKIPDTLCSGHSISNGIEGLSTDQQRVCETEAEPSHTGTGVPETDAKTNGAGTGQHSGNEPKNLNSLSSLTKLLNLQKDMARMQLQLSNLQDSMRTTNATLQELLDEAFSEM